MGVIGIGIDLAGGPKVLLLLEWHDGVGWSARARVQAMVVRVGLRAELMSSMMSTDNNDMVGEGKGSRVLALGSSFFSSFLTRT